MLKSLFCEDISVEYEFKSVKFKGGIDRLKNESFRPKWKHNGIQNITDAPTFTSIYTREMRSIMGRARAGYDGINSA